MLQKLSSKVDKVLYSVGKNMIMASYPTCNDRDARDPKKIYEYQECTKEISKTSSLIYENIKDIELFSELYKGEMSIQTILDVKTLKNAMDTLKTQLQHQIFLSLA